jgi:superfamily I DNA/RNA helicase
MSALRLFLDTHHRANQTFPAQLDAAAFAGFYAQYQAACAAENVVPLQTFLSYADGQAFCLNLAPDADAIRRAHARVGLPFDGVTEVQIATPQHAFQSLLPAA